MFSWHIPTQSRIKEIISSSDFSLEDLLQESYDLVVSATNDPAVYNYLRGEQQLKHLVNYLLKEPLKRDEVHADEIPELQKQFLFSTTACDTIAQSIQLLEALMLEKSLLDQIFNALKNYKTPIVFHRVTTLVMAFFSVNASEVLNYIKTDQPDFLKNLIAQIGLAPSEDITIIMRLLLRPNSKAPEIGEWLVKEQLVRLLIENLQHGKSSSYYFDSICRETVVVLQEVLNEVRSKSQIDHFDEDFDKDFDINFSSDEEKPPKQPQASAPSYSMLLLKQFEDPEIIDLFFSAMINPPTTLVYSLPFLIHLISDQSSNSNSSIFISKCLSQLDEFLKILNPKIPREGEKTKLGFSRLALMKFLIFLLKLDLPEVTAALVSKNSFEIALEVLFTFRENTIIQNLILEYFTIGLSRPLFVYDIVNSTKLTTKIIASWEKLNLESQSRINDPILKDHALSWLKKLFKLKYEPASRIEAAVNIQILRGTPNWGYFGHLFKLANLVVHSIADGDIGKRSGWSKLMGDDNWVRFVEDVVKVYEEIAAQKLDLDYSSDSDSSDED